MMTTIAAAIAVAYVVFASQFMTLFVDSGETTVVHVGVMFMRIVSPFYIVVGIKLLSDGTLRGTGKMAAFMDAAIFHKRTAYRRTQYDHDTVCAVFKASSPKFG